MEINLGDVNYRPRGVGRRRRGLGGVRFRGAWSFGPDISVNCGFFHKKALGLHQWHQFLREKCDQPVVSSATAKHVIMRIAKNQLLQFGNSPLIDFGSGVVHSESA